MAVPANQRARDARARVLIRQRRVIATLRLASTHLIELRELLGDDSPDARWLDTQIGQLIGAEHVLRERRLA